MRNKLLERQIKKYFGSLDNLPEKCMRLLDAISETYNNHDTERKMLERIIDLSSAEQVELNLKLRNETQEVKKVHEELRTLFENVESVFFTLDTTNNTLVQMSPSCEKMYGYTVQEFADNSNLWFEVVLEEDKPVINANYPLMLAGHPFVQEYRIRRRDGSIRWLESKVTPTLDENKALIRLDGVTTDITARKEADRKIKESEIKFRSLIENSEDMITLVNLRGQIMYGSPSIYKKLGYDIDEYLQMHAFDAIHPDDFGHSLEKFGAIVRNPDKPFYHSCRVRRKDGTSLFAEGIGTNMLKVAGVEAIVMNFRDVTERKEAEEKIKQGEIKFRALIENSHDGIAMLNKEGKILYVSPSVSKILGYEPLELIDSVQDSYIHPDDASKVNTLLESLLPRFGQTEQAQYRVKNKSGEWRWMRSNITNMLHEPALQALVFNYEDITEKVNAEIQLDFDRRNNDALINSTSDLMWSINREFKLVIANRAFLERFEKATGYEMQQGYPALVPENMFPEERQVWKNRYEKVLAGERFTVEDYRNTNGVETWDEVSFNPIFENDNVIGAACFLRDITERKLNELRILQSEKMMADAQSVANFGSWELDLTNLDNLQGNALKWSDEVFRIFGYKPGEYEVSNENFFNAVYSEDRELVSMAVAKAVKTNSRYSLDHRILRPDQTIRWVHEEASILLEEGTGRPLKMVGTVHDITERKQAELTLKQTEANMRNLLENTDTAYILLDENADIILWNQMALELSDKTLEGMLKVGKNYVDYMHESRKESVREAIKQVLSEGKNLTYEVDYSHRGRETWLYVRMHPIINEEKKILGLSVAATNITDRKKAEQLIEESNERYKMATKATKDVIWDWDIEQNRIYRSENYTQIFGHDTVADNVDVDGWISHIHPEDSEHIFKSTLQSINDPNATVWEADYRFFMKNGELAYVNDRGYIIRNNDGKPVRMVGAMQDITAKKMAEMEHNKITLDLVQRNKDLEQFAYIVSHNLRVPVANIIGLSEGLQHSDMDSDLRLEYIKGIATSSIRLDEVIKDLNHILQVKREINENKEPINFAELVTGIVQSIGNLINKENVTIKTDFEVENITSLKSYIHSIFYNIISNGIKYRQPGVPPLLEIRSFRTQDKVILSFKDNGMGIDLARRKDQVFGLYKRFHNHIEGKGMGLFMVKTQVETLGGKIFVDSEVNKGSEFIIEFDA